MSRRVSAMVWWEDTVDPTRFPFQYPVKKHCISFICVNFKFLLVLNIPFAFNLLFIQPLKFLPLIYLSFWPCFSLLFFWSQFHGVRFYALPGRLPRTMEDIVDASPSSSSSLSWSLSLSSSPLTRIKGGVFDWSNIIMIKMLTTSSNSNQICLLTDWSAKVRRPNWRESKLRPGWWHSLSVFKGSLDGHSPEMN